MLAFFGVELGCKEISAFDRGGKCFSIFGRGGDEGLIGRVGKVGVDEVEVRSLFETAPDGIAGLPGGCLIPAHVRDLEAALGGEAFDLAWENAKAWGFGGFLGTLEE